MPLSSGDRLGPYEVVACLGIGGMGEVYRARDTRLGREVALKILPTLPSRDPEQLRRFEQEARAVGALSHPNIRALYDVGQQDETHYVVLELLEGETLRRRLEGVTLSPRQAVDHAVEIARGLAAAHARGIVHRDLKPENIFLTQDGQVKILDFGLAKLTRVGPGPTTSTASTGPGLVLGTVGYMSPEQVRSQEVDHRSDIFSFGAILYEMLSGKRAFQGGSAVETMSDILKEEPPELPLGSHSFLPPLDRIVRHCLEKDPDKRFQSARDLAFDLEMLPGFSGLAATASILPSDKPRWRPALWLAGLALLASYGGVFLAGKSAVSPPSYRQLTFRRGTVVSARFAPDGHTIVYAAAWDGRRSQVFSTLPESPESRSLGLPDAEILSISQLGEMALGLLDSRRTLAQAPLAGGAPRELLEGVREADWAPDGAALAVVREVGGRHHLEYPIGQVLYETAGWIGSPRVSPRGDRVACLDHPMPGDYAGSVAIVDRAGKKTTLSQDWNYQKGVAWSPDAKEVWFSAAGVGINSVLYAASLNGRTRLVTRTAGAVTLQDIARDGGVLLTHDVSRRGIMCLPPEEREERDLYWLDWSLLTDLSADGRTLLFVEGGEAGGKDWTAYMRRTDGSAAVRLGKGYTMALSPDGKWVLSAPYGSPAQFQMLPTGPGSSQRVTHDALHHVRGRWFPDGRRLLFAGHEPGRGIRLYVQDLPEGKPRPITPEGTPSAEEMALSPDGKLVAASGPDRQVSLYPVEGGETRVARGLGAEDAPLRWSADGRSLFVYRRDEMPAEVDRVDLASGRRERWKRLMPPDPAGISAIGPVLLTGDGRSYAYSYERILSDLYLVEGLR